MSSIVWPYEVPIAVIWRDLDAAGHVNNAVYFTYFETARTRCFLQLRGGSKWQELDIILASTRCEFRSPATMGEDLVVRIRPTRIGGSSFALGYQIVEKKSGRLVAEGESVQVMFDYATQKSKPVPADVRAALEAGLTSA